MKDDSLSELIKRQDDTISRIEQIAEQLNILLQIQRNIGIKRQWFVCLPDNTINISNFIDAQSLYVDNIDGTQDVTLTFDNEPVSYIVKTGEGRFIPCIGAKTFTVSDECNVLAINKLIY